ncbi:hypothetical protein SH668x_001745 [Planctomicrobium sp. SH668]|uniref:hypothetical protein n=1 Tax=Planctomicrobium sp. SH668 TaxID=3448126 RepID=UPI003F5C8895
MKTLLQLLVAACIGAVAVVLNWMWLSRESAYPTYAAVKNKIAIGQKITRDDLEELPVRGDPELNNKSLVPWEQRYNFWNRTATREYQQGDLLFQRDIIDEAEQTQWDYIGPFTLVGIGSSPTKGMEKLIGQEYSTTGNVITLAVSNENNREKELLLRYLAAMRGEYSHGESETEKKLLKLLAIESIDLQTSEAEGTETTKTPLDGADRLIYVEIDGIPNAPPFLRIGAKIVFVAPYGKKQFLTASLPQ